MKKTIALLLFAFMMMVLLCACSAKKDRYTAYDYSFDTDVTLIAYCGSQKSFDQLKETVFGTMKRLHRAFDIYHGYEGVSNLYALNQAAGNPVAVEPEVMELLAYGKQICALTEGRVNIAMGAVLRLWHDARETGLLPEPGALADAMEHCAIDALILDPAAGTACIADGAASVDVGAIAKGWAAQRAAEAAEEAGFTDFVLSAGGNVVARGQADGRAWKVGVRDPRSEDGSSIITQVEVGDMALVTSGGYERNLTVEGKTYCHIIDPATGYPADHVLSATVICEDSALGDALSTAIFLMTPEEAERFVFSLDPQLRVILVEQDGSLIEIGLQP